MHCHRDGLLEAVNGDACLADEGKYAAVLEERGGGINTITGMRVVESIAPGWIGVQCDSEAGVKTMNPYPFIVIFTSRR